MRVVILGPYRSHDSVLILEHLRECLRTNGYALADIVRDMAYRSIKENESLETYYLEKSRDLIENWAQAAVFVFPKDCDYSGVLIEFDHMLNKAGWLLESSSVFFEEPGFEKVSLMLK